MLFRRTACRRFDNLVEVTMNQLAPLLLIMFRKIIYHPTLKLVIIPVAYLPIAFMLQSAPDVFFRAHFILLIFGITVAVAGALIIATVTGYIGNQVCCFFSASLLSLFYGSSGSLQIQSNDRVVSSLNRSLSSLQSSSYNCAR